MKNLYESFVFAISLILAGSAFASETPVYSDNKGQLQVPSVKVDGVPGVYQDIIMKFEDSDTLRMLSVKEGVLLDYINQVNSFQTNTFPVQVFLEISGTFPSGCGAIGQILQTVTGNDFSVLVYFENDAWLESPESVACTLAMRPFKKVIALDVYGLQAGTYGYTLNDKFSGSFSLATDNRIQ
ncbi:MAG: hypothetical protein Q7W55_06065 [Pseudohongiella sp.]|nr:hypothetical protein [Pseudohongiella sp.]